MQGRDGPGQRPGLPLSFACGAGEPGQLHSAPWFLLRPTAHGVLHVPLLIYADHTLCAHFYVRQSHINRISQIGNGSDSGALWLKITGLVHGMEEV